MANAKLKPCPFCGGEDRRYSAGNGMVNILPAVDVVQVIRCKDCRYYNRRWGCRKLEINVSADDYCFLAEAAVSEVANEK